MAVNSACKTYIPLLSAYVDGELTPSDRIPLERHLGACKDCAMRVADFRAESGLVRVGMEMLADEVDFKDFSTQVMARLTPQRLPLLERWKLSASEMFTHQRPMIATGFALAAMALIALPLMLRERTPEGYASERMAVRTVTTDEKARVAPVVLETSTGNPIIWVVDRSDPEAAVPDPAVRQEELELDPDRAVSPPHPTKSQGGEL